MWSGQHLCMLIMEVRWWSKNSPVVHSPGPDSGTQGGPMRQAHKGASSHKHPGDPHVTAGGLPP